MMTDKIEVSINQDKKEIIHTALNYLARREYSAVMLQKKLLQKGFTTDSIQVALQALSQEGLLNDQRFCEVFIANRIRQGYGPVRIAHELRQQGISEELISSELQQNESAWLDCIKKIQKKRFSSAGADLKERRRQIHYLQYRGFSLEQIKKCREETEPVS